MRNRALPIAFVLIIVALILVGVIYSRNHSSEAPLGSTPQASGAPIPGQATPPSPAPSMAIPGASPTAMTSPAPSPGIGSNTHPDLTADSSGLSKATVVVNTTQGLIKFKFYPQEAPNTVKRIVELANQGFYNGLVFHRVVPGFVIQTGDPLGNGTGGSGQKIKAEFNNHRHIEGTVAMARAADPDSADSQFYISLGTHPNLDHSYTVFGQVIEGMDAARKIKVGDKIVSLIIE